MAAYLGPRPSEVDLIETIRAYYPISVQRAMLTNQLQTIEQALDLLRRVELMEQTDHYQKPHQPIPNLNPNPNPNPSNQNRSGHNPAQVRQIQFSPSRNRSYGYRRRNRGNNNRGRGGEPSGEAPALSTLMPLLSREDRRTTDRMTFRETVKRSYKGPNGPREDVRIPRSTPGIPNHRRPR
jgi:hypothetical protein